MSESPPFMVDMETILLPAAPPTALSCLLCQCLLSDPVIAPSCGHTFCRDCLLSAASRSQSCPKHTNSLLDHQHSIPNLAIAQQVQELDVWCPHIALVAPTTPTHAYDTVSSNSRGSEHGRFRLLQQQQQGEPLVYDQHGECVGVVGHGGCQERVPLSSVTRHISTCAFKPSPCPNHPDCGMFGGAALPVHLAVCQRTPCRYHMFGCTFRGTRDAAERHADSTCRFIQDPLAQQGRILHLLNNKADNLMMMLETLRNRLTHVESGQLQSRENAREAHGDSDESDDEFASWREDNYHRTSSDDTAVHRFRREASSASIGVAAPPSGLLMLDTTSEVTPPFHMQCIGTLAGSNGAIWCMACSEYYLFAAGNEEQVIHVWSLKSHEPKRVKVLSGHTDVIHSLHIHDYLLYSGDAVQTVRVWDIKTLTCLVQFTAADHIICGLVTVDNLLVVASFGHICVWDIEDRVRVRDIREDLSHWVRCMCVLDGEQPIVYTATHDLIHAWETPSFDCIRKNKTVHGSIHSLCVSGSKLITGTYNRNIHVYNSTTLKHEQELKGHLGAIHSLALSPEGAFLFSASFDGTIKVWNLAHGLMAQSLQRHEASVNCITWHGNLLLSGSADHTIKMYKAVPGQAAQVGLPRAQETPSRQQHAWPASKLPGLPALTSPLRSNTPINASNTMGGMDTPTGNTGNRDITRGRVSDGGDRPWRVTSAVPPAAMRVSAADARTTRTQSPILPAQSTQTAGPRYRQHMPTPLTIGNASPAPYMPSQTVTPSEEGPFAFGPQPEMNGNIVLPSTADNRTWGIGQPQDTISLSNISTTSSRSGNSRRHFVLGGDISTTTPPPAATPTASHQQHQVHAHTRARPPIGAWTLPHGERSSEHSPSSSTKSIIIHEEPLTLVDASSSNFSSRELVTQFGVADLDHVPQDEGGIHFSHRLSGSSDAGDESNV